MQHPYQASVPTGKCIQQSLFPSWHDRRYSGSADSLLEGTRKSGSFELLQGIVKEKEQQEKSESPPLLPLVDASSTSSIPSLLANKTEKKQKCQSRCVKFME